MTSEAGAQRYDGSSLTVVIPTHRRWDILRRTLAALDAQTVCGFEVIVVVDGDADGAAPELGSVNVITVEHGGPGAARNAGVRASRRPLILFLGDDMIPDTALVEHHVRRHTAEPQREVAVLGHVDWHPAVANDRLLRWLDWSATQFNFLGIGDDAGFGRFYSCNVSLKRELFEEVGGFDPDFTYYYEDLDAGWRLGKAGMLLRYEPAARAFHLHKYDLPAIQQRFRGIATGERLMAAKHEWFEPFFHRRVLEALSAPPVARTWTLVGDVLHAAPRRFVRPVLQRANRWWYQQVGDPFLDVWEGERGLDELKAYLGNAYDDRRLREHMHEVEREEEAAPDEATFYRTSHAYLYDLTVFAMSGTKSPYLRDLRRFVPPGARLLDYGCGIGSDGLRLMETGYRVSFADFANPSTAFLRWRLEQRGRKAEIHDVDQHVPSGFDAVYCFDVIEHIEDPFGFLAQLEARARVVAVNFLEPAEHDVHVHKPLPVPELLEHVRRQGLLHYRRYHDRSHLVIYQPHAGRVARARSATALARGRRQR